MGDPLGPNGGLSAGCGQAGRVARSALFEMLDVMHTQIPCIIPEQYVDDMVSQSVGTDMVLAQVLPIGYGRAFV